MRADLPDVVRQERAAGATDYEIALLFARSRFRLPPGRFHHWTAIAVRAVMDEDEGGFPQDGIAHR